MTDRTPAQVAADNALDDAIQGSTKAWDTVNEDEIITTWVVVGAAQGQDDDRTTYFHLFPAGKVPTHTAVGLLEMAKAQLLAGDVDDDAAT